MLTPTTKAADHDVPISPKDIVAKNLMSQQDWDEVPLSLYINAQMYQWCSTQYKPSPYKGTGRADVWLFQTENYFKAMSSNLEGEHIFQAESIVKKKTYNNK